jgi:phosphatidylcholine synthase
MAWALHALTASGVVVGFVGLTSIIEGHPRAAILWLVAAMVLDGIDGPIARKIQVSKRLPTIDGNALDLIVDYFTCTIVPVAFLDKFDLLPDNTAGLVGFIILMSGALWMARTDMETDDNWFRGFPAEFNVIIPTLYLLDTNHWLNLGVLAVLCFFTLTYTFEFPHTVRVVEHRLISITAMVAWLGSMTILAIQQDHPTEWLRWVLIIAPTWTVWQVAQRYVHNRRLDDSETAPADAAP